MNFHLALFGCFPSVFDENSVKNGAKNSLNEKAIITLSYFDCPSPTP